MILMFKIKDRVELHPVTDHWIRGDRFGEVTMIGRKWIHVSMDRSGKTIKVTPGNIYAIVD